MRSAKLRYLWLLCLLLSACQPYPDHVDPIHDFRAESLDFGTRRELRLVKVMGDQSELLLVFNQPLQRLAERDESVPFRLDFRPRLPVGETSRMGAAAIRVRFAAKLPPAHSYSATIPAGWRALTGAAFLRSQEVSWETPRARLLEVHYEEEDGSGYWRLVFNQSVDLDSLRTCLQIEDTDLGEVLAEARFQLARSEPDQFRLSLPNEPSYRKFKLSLKPGLKSSGGPLPGEGGESFDLEAAKDTLFLKSGSRWLPQEGLLRLVFSSPVSERELRRSLKGLGSQRVEMRTKDQREYNLSFPELKGRVELTILKSLLALDGSHLSREVSIGLSHAGRQKKERSISRDFLRLKPGDTVMPSRTPAKSQIATWALTDAQVLDLLKLSDDDWSSKGKLALELRKPLYSASTKVSRDETRFLPPNPPKTLSEAGGNFLVRRALGGDKVERTLLTRSALSLDSWSLNQAVSVFVGSSSAKGSAGVRLQLLDLQGQVLSEAVSGSDGVARFSEGKNREPVLVRALGKGHSIYHILRPYNLPGPRSVPGLLWTHGTVFSPGSKARFFSAWWMGERPGEIEVLDAAGEIVDRISLGQAESALFAGGEFEVPKVEGHYRLRFAGGYALSAAGSSFSVSQLSEYFDSAGSSLNLEEHENLYKGHYEWQGPKAAQLDLRASLQPQVSDLNGWRLSYPELPNSLPVGINKTETLDGGDFLLETLPLLRGLWTLELELFDKRSPEAVVHRVKRELGEEILKLTGAEVRVLSPKVRMARFRFLFAKGENGPGRPLKCRFLEQDPTSPSAWRAAAVGQAVWRDGGYEWSTSFAGSGVFRVQCIFDGPAPDLEEHSVTWEKVLYSEAAIDGQEVLEVNPTVAQAGEFVRLRWPDLKAGTPVWLSVLSDGGEVAILRRRADTEGDLGQVLIPATHMGQSEVVLVAALAAGASNLPLTIRSRVVRMKRESLAEPLSFELESPIGGDLVLPPGSELRVPLKEPGMPELSHGLFWWKKAGSQSGPSLGLAEGLQNLSRRAGATMSASRLPAEGPVELTGKDELSLVSPQIPGTYELNFLGIDINKKLYFAEHKISVKRFAHWATLMPPWVRPGDEFWAGVRFWPSPELNAPTGTICNVDPASELLPQSYFTTAALTKAGKVGDMVFNYEAPNFVAAEKLEVLQLKWQLGVEGEEVPVTAELKILPSSYKEVSFRKRHLKSGEKIRLELSALDHWKLRLAQMSDRGGSAKVSVSGETLVEEIVELTAQLPNSEIYGANSDLTLWHKSGNPVEVEVLDLQGRSNLDNPTAQGLYVLRELQTEAGEALTDDGAVMEQENLISYHLVLEDARKDLRLVSPFPGGFQALGCWLRTEDSLQALDWDMVHDEMVVVIPELQAGEQQVVVSVKAVVAGEFRWPSSRVLSVDDKVLAQTQSSSVSVSR